MKKIVLTEILVLIFTVGLSVGLYHFFYGINLRCNNYFDILLFETRRLYLIYEIVTLFFIPIYLLLNLIRLVYFKFQKVYIFIEVAISTLGLMTFFFLHYLTLSSDGLSPAENGWTIYPPLTSIPKLNELDLLRLEKEKNTQLLIICIIFILLIVLTILTIRKNRKHWA